MAAKKATAELELPPTDLSEVFATEGLDPEADGLEGLDEDGDDEYEDDDETEDVVAAPAPVLADEISGKKTRKTRAPRQYIATDSTYDWVIRIEATSIRAAIKQVLETPDLGLQAGSSLIIAEVKVDTQLRVTYAV